MRDFDFVLLEGPVREADARSELKEVDLISNIDARWKIQKKLSRADVDVHTGRLQLLKADVEAHILPLMDEEGRGHAGTWSLPVTVVDDDKDVVYDVMKLTYYKYETSDGYVLNGKWSMICKDRALQTNDKVGLYWDRYEKEFRFAVLDRARGVLF